MAMQIGSAVGLKSIGAHILFYMTHPDELCITRLIYSDYQPAASSLEDGSAINGLVVSAAECPVVSVLRDPVGWTLQSRPSVN
ncbi:hypothetical protein [Microvirga pakistanensis]|uniref:hypothetical protein n=1 Tax=Microvirga pakistanensis TaxID=1682650 RepID=UPI00141B506B|nr:hypothetical protein [Microvirga pakistanensis]